MIPVEKNKEYTVCIDTVASDGNGVAHADGFAVFIPQTAIGDTVKIQITDIKKRFAAGKIVDIISPSPSRCNIDCEQYELCGGCQLRHINYTQQLEIKKNIIENAMRRIGRFSDFSLNNMVGAENINRYRNKMVFPVGYKDNKTVCGFYAPRTHDIVPLTDCLLGDELNKSINNAIMEYMSENNVSAYDEKKHTGIIRRIFTRKSFLTGEIMTVICANSKSLPAVDKLVERLTNASDRISSIILNINTKKNNFTITDNNITLWGKSEITDSLLDTEFTISPQSFFQINPQQTEKLYSKAIEFADFDKNQSVMDIYCGIGTISLCAAKKAKYVIGIEIVEKAVLDARKNALKNNIQNAVFYADSAENIVPKLIAQGETPDIVMLDPPRKGSDESTLSAIIKANPKRIVYISCNPATLARDARFIADNGYKLSDSCGFDLFPHTAHVECVVLLSRVDK